jgi:hypothetical protein
MIVPLLAVIVGAVVYVVATNGKIGEMARLTFGAGMLVLLYLYASHTVSLP